MYGNRYQKKKAPKGLYIAALFVFILIAFAIAVMVSVPDEIVTDYGEKLTYGITHLFSIELTSKTAAFIIIAIIAWFLFVSYYQMHYRDFHLETEHGSADWLSPEDATKELADEDEQYNRILSGNVKVSLRRGLANNNILLIGSSGDFKTTSVVEQNLLQLGSNYVMLDVKGDSQRKLGNHMKQSGYKIYSLNLKEPEKSDRYNPFVYIENENDLLRVVKALHTSLRPQCENTTGDPFWEDGMDLYLQSLFYWAWLVEGKEKNHIPTMNDVMHLVNLETKAHEQTAEEKSQTEAAKRMGQRTAQQKPVSELQYMMDQKAAERGNDYPPVRSYRQLKEGAEETVRSIVIMINAALAICNTAEVRRIFEDNDIDLREVGLGQNEDGKSRVALFLIIPDNNPVYNFIISMFYTQMFDVLIRIADTECRGPLPIPLEVWMDEFYAGARPDRPDALLGTVRSRNISMIIVLQSIAQLKTLFPNDKWETFTDNTACTIFLGSGPNAESTHKWISENLGNATADSRSDNTSKSNQSSVGLNYSRVAIPLMTPDEVKRMPPTDCIVFLKNRPPIYDEKALPFDTNLVQPTYIAQQWLKDRYKEATSKGDYIHPVVTYYDAENLRYVTVTEQPMYKIVTNPQEIEKLKIMAEKNPNMHMLNMGMDNVFLYINYTGAVINKEHLKEVYDSHLAELEKLKDIKDKLPVYTEGLSTEDRRMFEKDLNEDIERLEKATNKDIHDDEDKKLFGLDRSAWKAEDKDSAIGLYYELLPNAEKDYVTRFYSSERISDEEWVRFIPMTLEDKADFLKGKGYNLDDPLET